MRTHTAWGRFFAILVVGSVLASTLIASVGVRSAQAAAARIVCLSPGHGGSDTGAVNGNLTERDLNWTIAKELEQFLRANGYSVVYTHTDASQNPTNTQRAQSCNQQGADTVLWIHLNSSSDPTVDYFKAFWGKKNKDEAFCQTLTNNFKLLRPDGVTPLKNEPVGQFASSVMLKSNAPACLVENVFLSNTEEGNMFRDYPGVRERQIAEQLYNGLAAWYVGR
jgi:N-acetylmuramoyl-L-alanine amidase